MPRDDEIIPFYPWLPLYEDFSIERLPVLLRDAETHLRRVKETELREDDVLLCTFPKTGTHWVHEIVSMLLSNTTTYNTKGNIIDSELEYQEPEALMAFKGQRLLFSHLPFSFLPKQIKEKHTRIVNVNRNPKDRHVSMYAWMRGKWGFPDDFSWSDYFREEVLSDKLYTGWFNYTKECIKAEKDKDINVIQIWYEDLLLNPKAKITALAKFLEVSHTEDFIDEIVDKCTFHKFKDNKLDVTAPFSYDKISTLFRKGVIGDWKNWFTVSQNEQFDAIFKKEMENVDIKLTFEMP